MQLTARQLDVLSNMAIMERWRGSPHLPAGNVRIGCTSGETLRELSDRKLAYYSNITQDMQEKSA